MRVAFAGLGVMGFPMAGHLAAAGHEVTIYNRTASRADTWLGRFEGRRAATPADAAAASEITFCCVGNDDDVRAVVLGDDGILAGSQAGAIVVDHTTASAEIAREIHGAAHARQVGFLDAPLSGGQAGAENGKLTIMVGGERRDYDRALPVMQLLAAEISERMKCRFLAGPGTAQYAIHILLRDPLAFLQIHQYAAQVQ